MTTPIPSTMKALVLNEHGDLDQLHVVTDKPVPKATPGHVVIRVRASSFNYHDVFTVKGMPGIKVPFPVVIGLDMAGEIAELGEGVEGWNTGDRVLVNPLYPEKGPDGRNARWRHGAILPGVGRAIDSLTRCRELRRSVRVAGGLRHGTSHAGHAQDSESQATAC